MNTASKNPADERSDDVAPVAEPQSFGTWLRRQREVREIDLREIADSSKVSMSYLRAFEEDRFEVLPAPLFAKGFLRQYANYVGLDPEEVVNFYLAARQPEDEEPLPLSRTEPEPPTRNYLFFVLAVTSALVLLVWLLSVLGDRTPAAPDPAPVSAPAQVVPAPAPEPETGATTVPAGAGDSLEPSAPLLQPDVTPAQEPGPPLLVTLDFLADCWVEAAVDGAERLSELKVQGESLLLGAREVVEFKVGDVGAVEVEVNGIPYQVEVRRGTSVRNVRIDLATAAALAGSGSRPGAVPGAALADDG